MDFRLLKAKAWEYFHISNHPAKAGWKKDEAKELKYGAKNEMNELI
jgi:hypothetical protein